jgi:predicted nuclease of predicted toxin-antitoxin system
MRLLLDEHLDRRLKRFFGEEHAVVTVREQGWGGMENGELIEAAQREFDALITMDRGIPHQQDLRDMDLAIVLLEAPSNRLADLAPLVERVQAVLSEARPGEVLRVHR